nr:helix-turn-helix transcriptional regulator [uncultured Eisenbergiella sp.]
MQKIKHDLSLGANIRTLRRSCGLTQEQTIAKLQLLGCSLTRGSYAKIEAGIQNISVQELLTMKEVFHAELSDFFRTADDN